MTESLTIIQWYAVSLATLGLAVALYRARYQVSAKLSATGLWFRFIFVRWFASFVVIPRKWWWSSVTVLQFLLFFAYLTVNGLFMGLHSRNDYAVVARRCAMLSSINMMPLFLAGRPSFLVTFLHLPLHVHHLVHHWIGRVSIIQALLHIVFILRSHTNKKQFTLSGTVIAAALGCILLFSIGPMRRYLFEIFLKSHHILAIFSIGALLWHVSTTDTTELRRLVFPLVSVLLWVINSITSLYNLRIRSRDVEISKFYRTRAIGRHNIRELDIIQIDIKLTDPIVIRQPGQYVYLRVRDLYLSGRLQTHPFMISWWEPVVDINHLNNDTVIKARSLTMLIQPVNGLTRRLSNKIFLKGVSFDGPLGKNLQLEKYDNVFLAVKGIGIAGVLSYAKYLVELEPSPADKLRIAPRKVDLYWELDDNSQEEWGGPFLRELQLKNNDRSVPVLQVWCYFPSTKTKESKPLVNLNDPKRDFQYFYPDSKSYMKIGNAIRIVAAESVGRSIVVACGVSSFVKDVRAIALKSMSPKGTVEFVETEYRPLGESLITTVEQAHDKPVISGPVSMPSKSTGKAERRVTFI